ncbi:suppressor of fused domain protein [Chryseobacterium sp. SSA4.19]|uniref:suppressor of fused domain protein n=1 Tax=Chryseobacterium sp. SSA4.19 TaxID=2919915 RepID=UPI001F4D9424|nr:suppressor of fused domain protein [Chryseobacterium sp. SSA4.19]MCJ8155183.1 suppressor of fused domain protein [Chryseobacterium sp. SSA4.19]
MNTEEYRKQFTEDDAVGWECIDKELKKIYPDQEPLHFVPSLHYIAGGNDQLDGISVYKSEKQMKHFHFVTYGFSELYYNEKSAGGEFSKFGFELTFRLKMEQPDENISWVCNLLQNLARYVFKSGKWFEEYHLIPANGPIRSEYDTDITALAFALDPKLGKTDTPHGEVSFLQIIGITSDEYKQLEQNPVPSETKKMIDRMQQDNKLLITDLNRK